MDNCVSEKPLSFIESQVMPLRPVHAWKAAKTWVRAFENDPMAQYFLCTEKQSFVGKTIDRTAMAALLIFYCKKRIVLTVNSGASFLAAIPANPERIKQKGLGDYIIHAVLNSFLRLLTKQLLGSKEQRKRYKESEAKFKVAAADSLQDEMNMYDVMFLATEPKSQRHGYGGALLDSLTSSADAAKEATWLQSSNVENTEFYNSHGFTVVAEFTLGDNNPRWKKTPVVIRIMVRQPRSQFEEYSLYVDEDSDSEKESLNSNIM